jgi:membrane associated rhomboid family serine protease
MELLLLPISFISLISICIIIFTLLIAVYKKLMMTYSLIIVNFIIFILTLIFQNEIIFGIQDNVWKYAGLAFRPIYLSIQYSPQLYTLFTSLFIHGGFAHIFGNMLVFFFIGMAFEQRIGWKRFITIYLLSGIFGTITHSLLNIGSVIPLVGASGAIFGIMGAFAYSFPTDEVVMPVPLGIIMIIRRIKVIYAVLLFAILETIIVIIGVNDTTAHFAHLGGLVSGVILATFLIKNRKGVHKETNGFMPYDSYNQKKRIKVDFADLRKLAITQELKKELKMIEKENVPQVRDIWIEHFIEKAICPKCKNSLKSFNGKIWCEKCDYKSKY